MFDLFGLRKGTEPPGAPAAAASAARAAAGGRGPWQAALAIDTLLLFAFGGMLSRALWLKVKAPAPVTANPAKPRRPVPKAAPAPAVPAAKTPEAPPPKEAPPPSPKKAEAVQGPVGSPKVAAPELPPHPPPPAVAPEPAEAPRQAASAGKQRAIPTEFACRAKSAGEVRLKGAFLVRTGGFKPMVRGDDGLWRLTVSLLPGAYTYHCVADGKRSKAFHKDVP